MSRRRTARAGGTALDPLEQHRDTLADTDTDTDEQGAQRVAAATAVQLISDGKTWSV